MADFNLTTSVASDVLASTTLTILRGRLRVELHDEDDAAYRWEDATLNRHIERAARELSLVSPRELTTTLSAEGSTRELSLETLLRLVSIDAVEYPVGEYPASYVQFGSYGSTLTLLIDETPEAGAEVRVYWGGLHVVDASGSTLRAAHEDIVVMGAAGYAALEWANFAANRANFAGTEAHEQYLRWGTEQLQRFREQLAKLRETARVRAGAIFSPASPRPQRSVVQWEPS